MNSDFLDWTDRAFGQIDPSLAVGLSDIAFYSTELPFLNVLKQAGDRYNSDGAWDVRVDNGDGTFTRYDYSEAAHAGFLDENGYLQNLPENSVTTLSLFNSIDADAGVGGRYVFFYEGEADFTINGANIVEDLSEPGKLVVDLADGTPFGISVTSTNPDNHLRDFALVREENVELYEAGALFNPDFIELFADHSVLRFMDWMETNHSNQIEFSDLATFDSAFWGVPANQSYEYEFAIDLNEFTPEELSELPRGAFTPIYVDPITREPFRDDNGDILVDVPTDLLPQGIPTGVPLEVMVALANQVGADPWFNIPHQASDEYVREFAEYVRDNLDPGLVAHFEYSNEVWNGQFEQFSYANAEGVQLFGDEFGDFPVNYYYGYRSAEVLDIVNDVFADEADARVHGVFATQTVNTGVLDQAIIGAQRYLETSSTANEVSDLFDSVAVTGYYGPVIAEGTPERPGHLDLYRLLIEESKALFAAGEAATQYDYFIEQVTQDLRDGSVTNAYFQNLIDNGNTTIDVIPPVFSIDDIRGHFQANKAIADQLNLPLIQYEGGSHILTSVALQGDAELLDFLAVLNRSQELADINSESLAAFREEGGTLANDFGAVAQHNQFGPWGTLENLNDITPTYESYQNYNQTAAAEFGSINVGRDHNVFQQGITQFGAESNDTLVGTRHEDFLVGSEGNDVLVGGLGDDGLNGGAGFDVAVFRGTRSDYSIVVDGDGFTITGDDGVDFLINVEVISFEDGEEILTQTFVDGASPFVNYYGGQTFQAEASDQQDFVTIVALDGTSQTGTDLNIQAGAAASPTDIIYFAVFGDLDEQTREVILSGVENADGVATLIGNVADIEGTTFSDRFEGHATGERVDLGHGDDFIFGAGGDDTLSGSTGNDTIDGGLGDDILSGGLGADSIDGGAGFDILNLSGARTNFTISVEGDGYRIIGSEGSDFVTNVEVVSFTDGQSIIIEDWAAGVHDSVRYFGGGVYETTQPGFAGIYISPVSSETVTGDELGIVAGANIPTTQIIYSVAARDNQFATFEAIHDFGVTNAVNVVELISNVGLITGTANNDIFDGSENGENASLGDGDDRLNGFGGNDTLDGGAGVDVLLGGQGDDQLRGGSGDDVINGGSGIDSVVLAGTIDQYTLEEVNGNYVISGVDGTDSLFAVERAIFEDGTDVSLDLWFEGSTPEAQDIQGGTFFASNASISGVLINFIDAGTPTANDLGVPISGFTSALDTVYYVADRDNGDATYDAIHNGATGAFAVADLFTNASRIVGSDFDDIFVGAVGDEDVDLGDGDDRLDGFDGNDTLRGGAGNDFIGGGAGDDLLSGGAGDDIINGGSGDDIVEFSGLRSAYTISQDGAGYTVSSGVDGTDSLFATEYARFSDGETLRLEDWLANAVQVDDLGGGAFVSEIADTAVDGLFIGAVDPDSQTATDFGVPNEGFTTQLDTLFFAADRSNAEATFTSIHGGLSGALDVAELFTGAGAILGSIGNDIFEGGSAAEFVALGAGNDTLIGLEGDDTLFGGDGNDSLNGSVGNDFLSGGAGADVIDGGTGHDTLSFADLAGPIFLNFANGQHSGDALGDIITNIEAVTGTDSDDQIILGSGILEVLAFGGNDFVVASSLDTTVSGGDGDDTIRGGNGNDALAGDEGNDRITDGLGDDTLSGKAGADTLLGSLGDDFVDGGEGDDRLFLGRGNDTAIGGDGDDFITSNDGGDFIDGGAGFDVVSFRNQIDRIVIDLNDTSGASNQGAAAGDQFVNIEQFEGGRGADLLLGDDNDNVLLGNAGSDTILGFGGDDVIRSGAGAGLIGGGAGDDMLFDSAGNDTLSGDAGNDTLYASQGDDLLNGGAGNDRLFLGLGNDSASGGAGDDVFSTNGGSDRFNGGQGFDAVTYQNQTDSLIIDLSDATGESNTGVAFGDEFISIEQIIGGQGDDHIIGNSSDNNFDGFNGNDTLEGGEGNDSLFGSFGDDVLQGGIGDDFLDGGEGFDVVVFAGDRSQYQITEVDGGYEVTGLDGTDFLTNIEEARFSGSDEQLSIADWVDDFIL